MSEFGEDHEIGMVLLSADLKVMGMNSCAKSILGPTLSRLGESLFRYHPQKSHKKIRSILRQSSEQSNGTPILKIIDVLGKILLINFGRVELAQNYQEPSYFMTFLDATVQTNASTNHHSGMVEFNKFPVMGRRGYIFLNADDIYLFESDGNYCHVYTSDRCYYIQITLKTILERYKDAAFFQIHKSFIANLNKIKRLTKSSRNQLTVVFTDHTIPNVPVARRRVGELKRVLALP